MCVVTAYPQLKRFVGCVGQSAMAGERFFLVIPLPNFEIVNQQVSNCEQSRLILRSLLGK